MSALALRDVYRALPPRVAPLVEAIAAAADARDERLYLVGGPVRDLLLGLSGVLGDDPVQLLANVQDFAGCDLDVGSRAV